MVKLPDVEYTSYRHVHRRVQSDVAIAHFKFMMITKGLTDLERILFRSREQTGARQTGGNGGERRVASPTTLRRSLCFLPFLFHAASSLSKRQR